MMDCPHHMLVIYTRQKKADQPIQRATDIIPIPPGPSSGRFAHLAGSASRCESHRPPPCGGKSATWPRRCGGPGGRVEAAEADVKLSWFAVKIRTPGTEGWLIWLWICNILQELWRTNGNDGRFHGTFLFVVSSEFKLSHCSIKHFAFDITCAHLLMPSLETVGRWFSNWCIVSMAACSKMQQVPGPKAMRTSTLILYGPCPKSPGPSGQFLPWPGQQKEMQTATVRVDLCGHFKPPDWLVGRAWLSCNACPTLTLPNASNILTTWKHQPT